ncbi:MAG TPA: substrate-binding domain-containing protein [Usitatibacter sp.]|nr:substrate-binding domain-containing protein [Usitatibacter sp.]
MKLRFVSAGAAQALVAASAKSAGIAVEGSFGAVGAMLEKFLAGEPCDIVVLTRRQIDELAARGLVLKDSVADLGAVPTSIAVRAADSAPPVCDEATLRDALLAADAIYFPDPAKATAGIHFNQVLERLGIHAKVASRIRTFPNGATAMRAMADAAGHPIGCTQATEIRATVGVKLVAPLPAGFDLVTVYTGAVSAVASEPAVAARFLSGLASRL